MAAGRVEVAADLAARELGRMNIHISGAAAYGRQQLLQFARGDALAGRADHVGGGDVTADRSRPLWAPEFDS